MSKLTTVLFLACFLSLRLLGQAPSLQIDVVTQIDKKSLIIEWLNNPDAKYEVYGASSISEANWEKLAELSQVDGFRRSYDLPIQNDSFSQFFYVKKIEAGNGDEASITPSPVEEVITIPVSSKLEAPMTLGGLYIETTVTNGVDPLASQGKWVALPDATSNKFALIPVTMNIAATFGTYSYNKLSNQKGVVNYYNAVNDYNATLEMDFETSTSGKLVITVDEDENIFQTGNFEIKTGNAPEDIADKNFRANITDGDGFFAEYGSFEFNTKSDGTYEIIGLSGEASSSFGTYRYSKDFESTAVLIRNDNSIEAEFGVNDAIANFTFDSASSGAYYIMDPRIDGYQTGLFEMIGEDSSSNVNTEKAIPLTLSEGQKVRIIIEQEFPETANYQWMKDGNPIVDSTSATLYFNSVKKSDEGIYHAIIKSGNNIYESDSFQFIVVAHDDGGEVPVAPTTPEDPNIVSPEDSYFLINTIQPGEEWDTVLVGFASSASEPLRNDDINNEGDYSTPQNFSFFDNSSYQNLFDLEMSSLDVGLKQLDPYGFFRVIIADYETHPDEFHNRQ